MRRSEALAVLGLREGCGPEEVRAAYKRLALLHHPDKGGSQEEFVRLKEAFECVSGEKPPDISSLLAKGIGKLFELFTHQQLAIKVEAEVSVKEVYEGKVKKLTFRRRLRDGTFESRIVLVGLAGFQERHKFPGLGDEGLDGKAGDLIVTLRLRDAPLIGDLYFDPTINNADLHAIKEISLADHLLGCTIQISLPDGTGHEVNVRPLEKEVLIIPSLGFPTSESTRGDLIIKLQPSIQVADPAYLDDTDFIAKVRHYFTPPAKHPSPANSQASAC